MNRNARRRAKHKISLALINAYSGCDCDEAQEIQRDAEIMVERLEPVYDQKRGAGALWLDRKLQDTDWLIGLQDQVIKTRRILESAVDQAIDEATKGE